jgi:hypothetical protein
MIKIIMNIVLFFFSSSLLYSQSYIDTLLSKYPLKDKEVLAVLFVENGSCPKCVFIPESAIDSAIKKTCVNVVIVAFVGCSRTKEINSFQKNFNWKYYIEPDIKRSTRNKLGCHSNTELCLINSKGKIIAECSVFDSYQQILKDIISTLEKLE